MKSHLGFKRAATSQCADSNDLVHQTKPQILVVLVVVIIHVFISRLVGQRQRYCGSLSWLELLQHLHSFTSPPFFSIWEINNEMTVFVGPSGREHNAGGQRGWSLWRSHTGRMNNEHTLFSRWAGSALQTIGPSLSSSAMSDNDHIQPQPPSYSLLTYMSIECESHDELQEVRPVCVVLDKKPHVARFLQRLLATLREETAPWFLLVAQQKHFSYQHRSAPK